MRNPDEINECADILDSRDIEARIDHLESEIDDRDTYIEEKRERFGEIQTRLPEADAGEREELKEERQELSDDIDALLEEKKELQQEWRELTDFRDEVSCSDWIHGETLIAEHYFEDYARDLASDCCEMPRDLRWPFTCIDWEEAAEELKQDYSSAELRGHTFYFRA